MKKFIVILAVLFHGFFYAQEQIVALTKEDIPEEVQKIVDINSLTFVVDTQPNFNGGLSNFRKEFSQNFDTTALHTSAGKLKTLIFYVVEIDGSIQFVKAIGENDSFNKEAERALKSIKTRFAPAKVNNMEVRYLMRLPLSMNFK